MVHTATMIYFTIMQKLPPWVEGQAQPTPKELIEAIKRHAPTTSATNIATDDVRLLSFHPEAYTPAYMHTRFTSITDSRAHDDEWRRLMTCRDPHDTHRVSSFNSRFKELSPNYRFTKGSLTAEWDGRFLVRTWPVSCTFPTLTSDSFPVAHRPSDIPEYSQQWTLSQHHRRRFHPAFPAVVASAGTLLPQT